jgi:hypothetical protein
VTTPRAVLVSILLAAALVTAGCGDSTTPTSPTTPTGPVTETYNTQVWPGGFASRTFVVTTSGTVSVTLTTATPADATLGLVVGVPQGIGGCAPTSTVSARASSTPQIVLTADKGVYCTMVYDLGTLTDPVSFTIKIEHP